MVEKKCERGERMGLEITVAKTTGVNLEELYAVHDAVREMDWYLGDDRSKRAERWIELKNKCMTLTKNQVLDKLPPEEVRLTEFMKSLDEVQFKVYLGMLVDSISPHEDGNTHLNFDYDKFPAKDLWFSCSRNLHRILLGCRAKDNFGPDGDYVVELDQEKVLKLVKLWVGKRTKLKIAQWIGYFFPNVGSRILQDCQLELCVNDSYVDIHDMEHYMEKLVQTGKAMDQSSPSDRFWMISSY